MRAALPRAAVLLALLPWAATALARKPTVDANPYEAAAASASAAPAAASDSAAAAPTSAPSAAASEPDVAPARQRSGELAAPDTRSAAMLAYQRALEARKLAATAPLSRGRIRDELAVIEPKLADGRRDEAIGDLVYLVEAPRFSSFAETEEGRAATFLLGDSLGRAGAYEPARGYLLRLVRGTTIDPWYRKSVRSLVDFGLESDELDGFVKELEVVPPSAPPEVLGDVSYLRGRALEQAQRPRAALAEYAKVGDRSRFWAQANYRSGLIEAGRGEYKSAEGYFCKIADSKLTPKRAPLSSEGDFFRVRDLARLGLGRVAHEQYRFDDSRYYYYLVPHDSEQYPEALYESATSRYEKKDYAEARELLDELEQLHADHAYADEAHLLSAFVDMAVCNFASADRQLDAFVARYEPVRDAARSVAKDPGAVRRFVEAVHAGNDPASAGLGVDERAARTLGGLLRIDAGYGKASRRVAILEHQLAGLLGAMGDLDLAQQKLAASKEVKPQGKIEETPAQKLARIDAQLSELRRILREAERQKKKPDTIKELRTALDALELQAKVLRDATRARSGQAKPGEDLPGLLAADRERATRLYNDATAARDAARREQLDRAADALVRVDRRLSRLLARARLGRIETVLGKKRALEIEVEALTQGYLPQSLVDSMQAERYLKDDEEYWPFDGEDWRDEYVGGEGLE